MKIFIFLIMISGNLSAQVNKLEKISGLLIFSKTDSIPQDVIFIPVKNINEYNFEKLIDSGLAQNLNKGFFVYFQGMRWRTPELASLIKESYQTTGTLKDKKIYNNITLVQILLANIVFRQLPEEEFTDPLVDKVELIYNNKSYLFDVWWSVNQKMGSPILFEKIEPMNKN